LARNVLQPRDDLVEKNVYRRRLRLGSRPMPVCRFLVPRHQPIADCCKLLGIFDNAKLDAENAEKRPHRNRAETFLWNGCDQLRAITRLQAAHSVERFAGCAKLLGALPEYRVQL